MNKKERTKMVKAMEFIVRQMNDMDEFMTWLVYGVADGDIDYGDLSDTDNENSDTEYYTEDNNFSEIMELFLKMMSAAKASGGLYCDGILSGKKYYSDFMDDGDKMVDFFKLSKEEFLKSYSYLNEEEYNATLKKVKEFTKER